MAGLNSESASVTARETDDLAMHERLGSDRLLAAIRSAADRVRSGLARELDGADLDLAAFGRLDLLVEALGDGATKASAQECASEAGFDSLLDLLYAEVLNGWATQSAPISKTDMLSMLQAFQRVRDVVARRPNEQFSLVSPLPQDTDLVVELAHDLRSPLTSIIFLTEALRRGGGGDLTELQRRQLGIIYSAALSLVSMASDVIELGRGGARLLERHPSPLSISELLDSTCDILMPVAQEKGLELRTVRPPDDHRYGHPVALSRVLLNLTANALKYTEKGYVEMAVCALDDSRVEISVRDTGPGLHPDAASKIFEPLRRNPVNNRFGFSGSGLGLTICRRLVNAMGGDLRYESSRGVGTRFHFVVDLPRAPRS